MSEELMFEEDNLPAGGLHNHLMEEPIGVTEREAYETPLGHYTAEV